MSTRRSLVITFCITLLCAASFGIVSTASAGVTKLYYYSAKNCPHCQEYGPLIHKLTAQLPGIELVEKDIWQDRSAFKEMIDLLATHGDLPVSEDLSGKVLSLPMHTELEQEQLLYICQQIAAFFRG